MLPGRCEWLPTAPVSGICLYECDPVFVCDEFNLDGLKAKEKFCVYDWMLENKSSLHQWQLLWSLTAHCWYFNFTAAKSVGRKLNIMKHSKRAQTMVSLAWWRKETLSCQHVEKMSKPINRFMLLCTAAAQKFAHIYKTRLLVLLSSPPHISIYFHTNQVATRMPAE